jgi:hypothetical protein
MPVPGNNLLATALTIIAPYTLQYYQANGRALNDLGEYVTTYAAPVNVKGSFQPVPRNVYDLYGLDWQKSYFVFYTQSNMIDVQRDKTPDKLVNGSQTYVCESNTADWFQIDRWKSLLCVLVNGQAG